MKKEDIEIILRDFKMISSSAFEHYEETTGRKPFADGKKAEYTSMPGFYRLHCKLILYPSGIAWFGGGEGIDRVPGYGEKPIGKPEDYIKIKDGSEKLAGFIGKTLDRGILEWHSPSGHGDRGETYTADYILWLYWCCGKGGFKRNLEEAAVKLLEGELKREFVPYDIGKSLKKEEEDFAKGWEKGDIDKLGGMFGGDSLEKTISRAGDCYSKADADFKKLFEMELGRTERKMTFEEFYGRWGGGQDKDKMRKSFARYNPPLRVVHFNEASVEFKEAFKQRYLRKRAEREAIREFTPQFNRLAGILQVISMAGTPYNGFAKASGLLEQKMKEWFFRDAPDLQYPFSSISIYRELVKALGAVWNKP